VKYEWLLESGITSNKRDPKHLFNSSGIRNVCLIADNGIGTCQDTICQKVEVYSVPNAMFTPSSNNQCGQNKAIDFTNKSTIDSGSLTFEWSFGDGVGSTLKDPSHTYGQPGYYQVKLVAISDRGCKDSIGNAATQIRIREQPEISFDVKDSCFGGTIKFTNTTNNTANKWLTTKWDMGDGSIVYKDTFRHYYANPGKYDVKLTMVLNNNCVDSFTKAVTVFPTPTPRLVNNNAGLSVCQGNSSFTFHDSSSISDNSFLRSTWMTSKGDTQILSKQDSFSTSFPNSGKYWIYLHSISNKGCTTIDSSTVEIYPEPVADFVVNDYDQCLLNNRFSFTSMSKIPMGGGSLNHEWSFGNGANAITDTSLTYTKPGTYLVTYKVVSSYGCFDVKDTWVRVYEMPTANFDVNNWNQCLSSNKFDFVNNSTIPTGNGSLKYAWEFSPTDIDSGMSPSRSYSGTGAFPVLLRAISSFGCLDDTLQYVNVLQNPDTPIVRILDAIPCHGMTGRLEIVASGGSGPYTYSWNGASFTPTNYISSAPAGTYQVTIRDNNGCESSGSYFFDEPDPLLVTASLDSNAICYNSSTGGASVKSISGGTSPYRYVWTKGTNQYFGSNLTKMPAGTYYLVATDNNGCIDSTSVTINQPLQVQASYKVLKEIKCFDSTGKVSITAWGGTPYPGNKYTYYWDGDMMDGGNVKNNLKAGVHTVEVRDENFCVSSRLNIQLTQPEPMQFALDSTVDVRCYGEANGKAYVTVSGGTADYKYQWFKDDVFFASGMPLIAAGEGYYQLFVTDKNQCPDTMDIQVSVEQPDPLVIFNTINKPVDCQGGSNGELEVTASGGNGNYTYTWTQKPNNVIDSTLSGLSKGLYFVRVEDEKGCFVDTFYEVDERPHNPVILPSDSVQICEFDSLILTSYMNEGVSYNWSYGSTNFGWSSDSTLRLANVDRTKNGYYKITAQDRYGCEDEALVHVKVNLNPIVSITSDPKIGCIGSNVDLIASGTDNYVWFRPRFNPFGFDTIGYGFTHRLTNIQKSDTGIYLVKGISDAGCYDTAMYRLQVGLDSISVEPDREVCEGSLLVLKAKGGVNYTWEGPTGNIVNSPNYVLNPVTLNDNGTYRVTISDKWSCTGIYETKVRVRPKPIVAIDDIKNGIYCDGESLKLVANTDADSIDWLGPNNLNIRKTTDLILSLSPMDRTKQGTYKLIGYSQFGCIDSTSQFVSVYSNPTADFDLTLRCKYPIQNEDFNLNSSSTGAWRTEYYFDNELISTDEITKYQTEDLGIHSIKLRVINDKGCIDEKIIDVEVKEPDYIELPNAFTPNNDLINNVLEPVKTDAITNYRMKVYNRWGQKVWEGYNQGWDGRDKSGDYYMTQVYVVEVDYSSFCSEDESILSNPPRFGNEEGGALKKTVILLR
jgi:gliding motility-associated-like protein